MHEEQSKIITKERPLSFFLVLVTLTTFGHTLADMYVPSLPAITHAFGVPITDVQFSVSAYMLTFSLSQLVYGPLSERFGRKPPIYAGLILCLIGTVICATATDVTQLIMGRFVQGVGGGAAIAVGRAIARDIYSGETLAKVTSYLGMTATILLALSPVIGGYLQEFFFWQAVFIFLTCYICLITFLFWFKIPESAKTRNIHMTKPKEMLAGYKELLTNRRFIGFTMCLCCTYAGFMAYFTASPFLLQTLVGLTPAEYGWLAFVVAGSISFGSFCNARLISKFTLQQLMMFGITMILTAGLSMTFFGLLNIINAYVIVMPFALCAFGAGFIFGNSFAGALRDFSHLVGLSVALLGALQMMAGSFSSAIMALLPEHNQVPLGMTLTTIGLTALISARYIAFPTAD